MGPRETCVRGRVWALGLALATALTAGPATAQDAAGLVPLKGRVRKLAGSLVESGVAVGLVVGVLRAGETTIVGSGKVAQGAEGVPDGDTIYEIGSVTKTFTALVLADLARSQRVSLNDSVRTILDPKGTVPGKQFPPITLLELATHTSGLPRMPSNFEPANAADPYADYDAARLRSYLAGRGLALPAAARYAYSNLGYGLLGQALATRTRMSYEQLVTDRVLRPLEMRSTGMTWRDDLRARTAPGYSAALAPVHNWHWDTLAGAGALRSSVNDMLKFVEANARPGQTGLGPAIRMSHEPQRFTDRPPRQIGLAWVLEPGDEPYLWHNGSTGGYHSWISVNPEKGTGVVVLCNTATDVVDQLGRRLQTLADGGKVKPLGLRRAVTVPADTLERYVGNYAIGPRTVMAITRERDELYAQMTGQERLRLFAASATRFFYRSVKAEIEFLPDEEGPCPRFMLHQGGRNLSFVRTERGLNDVAQDPPVIKMSTKQLRKFVGTYEFGEGRELAITLEGGDLHARYTGQSANLIRPHGLTSFHYPGTEARLEFELDKRGKAIQVTYIKGAVVTSAKRID